MIPKRIEYKYSKDPKEGILVTIPPDDLANFDPRLLNLGDIKAPAQPVDVLAVLFDLEGFTDFTRQVDPQLTVPIFISDFLQWLFDSIKRQLIQNEESATLWSELPFFSKFMGDGVLFLWRIDLEEITKVDASLPSEDIQYNLQEFICNIVASLLEVCEDYSKFLATVETQHVGPPSRLRCGIARGIVIPIGKGADYVGPCINIAARLQKFNGLTFAFSARGINSAAFSKGYQKEFLKKRAIVRGIGERELVYVLKEEFEALPEDHKTNLKNPDAWRFSPVGVCTIRSIWLQPALWARCRCANW